jgi:hypothetical protein
MQQGSVVIRDNVIQFIDVPLSTPNGDILVEKLNLEVRLRMSLARHPVHVTTRHATGGVVVRWVSLWGADAVWHQRVDQRTQRLRQVQSLPRAWRSVAAVRWHHHQAAAREAVLHSPEAVPHAWFVLD